MSSVHLQKPAFIVFEGLDGSGKSTCARLLADTIDAEYLTTPSPDLRAYREDVIASFAGCQEANQLFYLATVFATSANARDLIGEGRPVVLDRYFLSTQAYAVFRGTVLDLDQVAKDLLPADITVFLDVSLPIRHERLSRRGATGADIETLNATADVTLRHTHSERFGLPVVGTLLHLQGDRMTPEEIVSTVRRELEHCRFIKRT